MRSSKMTETGDSNGTDSSVKMFAILRSAGGSSGGRQAARRARLELKGRKTMETPGFYAVGSRGTVPHVTPDNVSLYTEIPGVMMALEDFIERPSPPIYQTPPPRLHTFTATPSPLPILLTARRTPQIPGRTGNTDAGISVFTSTGFGTELASEYPGHVTALQPDIAVPLVDLTPSGNVPASHRRMMKMAGRTKLWLSGFLAGINKEGEKVNVFAPVLPTAGEAQEEYLKYLVENVDSLDGLAFYENTLLDFLEQDRFKPLAELPRISLTTQVSPHSVVTAISHGIDVILPTFLNTASDAGIALTFTFPTAPTDEGPKKDLGDDIWASSNATSLSPLVKDCTCYTCTKHHRAYIHHLINAKEMLGWSLLQIHNYHIFSTFMATIRETISTGTFAEMAKQFTNEWHADVPKGTGERPRARGYHFKSAANQPKANKAAWSELSEAEEGPIQKKVKTDEEEKK